MKILGLQRTGTNLAAYLASRNFGVTYLTDEDTGWKHGKYLPGPWSADAKFILCARHPLAHLLGFWRLLNRDYAIDGNHPPQYRTGMSFAEFLETPCYEFANPVDRWNRMYGHWLDALPNERTALVRLEDQSDQSWVIGYVGRKLGLTPGPLVATTDRIDVGAESRGPFAPSDLSEYTPALAYSVESRVDRKVMSRLGYGFRTSSDGTEVAPAKCGGCGSPASQISSV